MSDATSTVIPSKVESPGEQAQVVVRRRSAVPGAIGVGAAVLAAMYLWRAAGDGGLASWLVGGALLALAGYHLREWVGARIPLLVADEIGIRLRIDDAWHGLIWSDVAGIGVRSRQGLFGDGHVMVRPLDSAALEGFGPRREKVFTSNTQRYGAPLVTVLGIGTVTSVEDLSGALTALADGRTLVVASEPAPSTESRSAAAEEDGADPDSRRGDADSGLGDADSARGVPVPDLPAQGVPVPEKEDTPDPDQPSHPEQRAAPAVRALRMVRRALRAEVRRRPEPPPPVVGTLALDRRSVTADGRADSADDGGAPIRETEGLALAEQADAVPQPDQPQPEQAPGAVEEDPQPHPEVPEPTATELAIIGPELAKARNRLGVSIDDLASRTRIRAHVIEAIEVDDFGPCGGDFYARGHIASLARVLGVDSAPLLEAFEERYAHAPINPRRVFEAELATAGAIRGVGVGGPNWTALVATVLVLLMIWGIASYFTDRARPTDTDVPSVADGSGGISAPTRQLPAELEAEVRLIADGGDARVVATAATGEVVFRGQLLDGQTRWLRSADPFRVRLSDGGVVRVQINGRARGFLGEPGTPMTLDVTAVPAA
jgi:cytoskeleton protein RodZ